MDDQGPRAFRQLFSLQAITTLATIVSAALTVFSTKLWIIAALAAIATIYAQWRLYRRGTKSRLYEFRSETDLAFVDFFSEWYDRDGSHYIFCKDLDWLDRPEVARIVETLRRRGQRTHIFVSEDTSEACQRIRASGGHIYVVPPEIARIQVKMSLHDDTEFKQIIIRKKRPGTNSVRFIRTDDSYMVALAETLIEACKQVASTAQAHTPTAAPDGPAN